MIRVLVADDQALVRAGFRVLVDSEPDLQVIGEAAEGQAAAEIALRERPDVVLMDVRMPNVDGIEATRRISAGDTNGDVHVLILTTFDLDEYVFSALRAGASGFLLKDTPPVELLNGIRLVADGEGLLSPGVTRQLIEEFVRRPGTEQGPAVELDMLTERELQVLSLVAKGLSNSEIATRIYVTPATAKTHVSRLLMKLGARDRAQLIVIAYESGLVTPERRLRDPFGSGRS